MTPAALVLPAQAEDWEQPGARRDKYRSTSTTSKVIAPCGRGADGNWNHTVIVRIRATKLRRLGIHL